MRVDLYSSWAWPELDRLTPSASSSVINFIINTFHIHQINHLFSFYSCVAGFQECFKVSYYCAPATVSNTLVLSGCQRRVSINATAVSDRVSLRLQYFKYMMAGQLHMIIYIDRCFWYKLCLDQN